MNVKNLLGVVPGSQLADIIFINFVILLFVQQPKYGKKWPRLYS
jgi:hypothetical protein